MTEVVNLEASEIYAPHWARIGAADGQHQYILTGVIAPHLQGAGPDWTARTLRATLPIGGLDGKTFTASLWAPSVSLAAVDSEGATTNQGWAIDGFELVTPNTPNDHVTLDVHTAVRDAESLLLRIPYQITMVGSLSSTVDRPKAQTGQLARAEFGSPVERRRVRLRRTILDSAGVSRCVTSNRSSVSIRLW